MVAQEKTCDLCGLPVGKQPIHEVVQGEEKVFCCQGCARVYSIAAQNGMLDQVLPAQKKEPGPSLRDLPKVLTQKAETTHFSVQGMWCAGCSVAAEEMLRRKPGVREIDISFAAEQGRLVYDPELVNPEDLLGSLSPLGYRAQVLGTEEEKRAAKALERVEIQLAAAVMFGMQVMLIYIGALYPAYFQHNFNDHTVRGFQYLAWVQTSFALGIGGYGIFIGAWRALRARTASMDTLVALGLLSAYFYSAYIAIYGGGEVYFDSVIMITTFILIGRTIETMGGAEARRELRMLHRLQPDESWVQTEKGWERVKTKTLSPGATVLVKPGERVPLDGTILEGEAEADESLLTGESVPVVKVKGDTVFAGSLIHGGALTCRVEKASGSTRLAQIETLVNQTLSSKPAIQRLADRASAYFAFGIIIVAVIAFVGRMGLGYPVSEAVLSAVAVLVVACPCALGLATPLALSVTLGKATKGGILVRNLTALETATTIQRLAIDKTGTLTRGHPGVLAVEPMPNSGLSGDELLRLAASVEQFSEHPLGKAIVSACDAPFFAAGEFMALRGAGASARLYAPVDRRVLVGSVQMIGGKEPPELAEAADRLACEGNSVVWVSIDGQPSGYVALRDEINDTAKAALAELHALGVRVALLSGDRMDTTRAIAAELDIEDYDGGCTPEEKAHQIRTWQEAGDRVGMAGDGINDAPALAQANLSLAASGGTEIAGEASDAVLMRPDLRLIPWFLKLSKQSRQIIFENLAWAFGYNLVSVPLALLGVISPVIAAAAMSTSSLLVVFNSLRIRK